MEYHILHIEDSEIDADLIKRSLTKAGLNFSYRLATEKKELIEALKTFEPNIILCDHSLPSFNSKMAYALCKEKNPDLPFILVTGTVSEEFAVEMLKMGVDDYLLKSNLQRLPSAITNVLSKKEAEQKLSAYIKEITDYKFALDQSSIIEITDEKGIIKYANDNYLKISKYSREELIGQEMRSINSDYHSKSFMRDLWVTITNGKIWKGELKNKAKDGSTFWVDTTIVPFLDNEGKPYQYIAIGADITERKKSEDLLHEANVLARLGGWEIDLLKGTVYWSDITREIHEAESSFVPDLQNGFNFYKEGPDRNLITQKLKKAIELGKPWDEELQIVTAKNNVRWIRTIGETELVDGKCVRIIGSFQDIDERKIAEQEKNSLLITLEKSLNEIYVFDAKTLKFSFVNHGAIINIGYSEQEIKELTPLDIKPEFTETTFNQLVNPLLTKEKEKIIFFTNHKRKNGSLYPVEVHLQFVEEGNNKSFLAVILDITERNKIEEDKKQLTTRLQLATKSARMGIWEWDLENNTIEADKNMYKHYGIASENFNSVYDGWMSRIYNEDRQRVANELQLALTDKKDYKIEFRVVWNDSSIHYLKSTGIVERDKDGNAKRMIGANLDITERKEKEQHLKLLESVIINTKDAVLITEAEPFDEPGNKIVYVNEAFTKMTGYSSEEVIGKTPRILQGPNSDKVELKHLGEVIRKWQSFETTIINYKKNGEEFWNNISLIPVANENGCYTHWIAIERDVTIQKNHIDYIEKQNKQLREIAWSQSHLVRAPLARMLGIVSLIRSNKLDSSEYYEWLNYFTDSAKELDDIIKDITNKTLTIPISL